jgi:hypothetical protein
MLNHLSHQQKVSLGQTIVAVIFLTSAIGMALAGATGNPGLFGPAGVLTFIALCLLAQAVRPVG